MRFFIDLESLLDFGVVIEVFFFMTIDCMTFGWAVTELVIHCLMDSLDTRV